MASDYLEVELRKHIFRTGSFTKPSALYISLHTADPGETGANEVVGGNYARVQNDPGDANWSAPDATSGQTQNLVQLGYPAPSAAWGNVTHFGIWDAASAGNFIVGGLLDSPVNIIAGAVIPTFAVGAITVTII